MQITRKLIITNTFWSAVAQVGVMGINLLVLPLFIKNLGAELYGIWVLSGVVLGYLNVFDFGFTQGLQKYVAEARVKSDHNELSEVVVTGTGLLLCIGLLIGGICFFGAAPIVGFFNIQPENQLIAKQLLQISALFCVVMWPLRIVDVVLNASMRIKELSFLNAFRTGIQSVVMLGMVYVAADIVLIKWVTTILLAVCSTGGILLIKRYVPEINWKPTLFRIYQLRRMHKFSLGMFYISILAMLSVKVDNLVIAKMLDMKMVAIYAIIAKPYELIARLSGMLMQTLMPVTFNLIPTATQSEKERLVCLAVKYRTLILVPMATVAIWAIPSFFRLWVGEEYVKYAIWAQLFVGVHFFMGLASLGNIARADGAMYLINGMLTVKVLLNLGISIFLTLKIGIGGVILGTFLSNILFGEILFGKNICHKINVSFTRVLLNFIPIIFLGAIGHVVLSFFAIQASSWMRLASLSVFFYGILVIIFVSCFLRSELYWILKRRSA
jgi:O-antigen/teichoic acid export membrane protein